MRIAALSGGVGGAKLVHGLAMALGEHAARLTAIVNTGDDWEWNGLLVCPDADTVMYTLAGLANPETGWGLAGDTFRCLEGLDLVGRPSWFRIGDRDLATHLARTAALREGAPLSGCTADLARCLGVVPRIVPASDDPVRTRVATAGGELDFQDYFVRRGARDPVLGVRFAGAETARPSPDALEALETADLVVICPSNPVLSIGPILAVAGLRQALAARVAGTQATGPRGAPPRPVVAISPLVGGRAVKGPTVEVMRGLGVPPTAAGVAATYRGLISGFVVDAAGAPPPAGRGAPPETGARPPAAGAPPPAGRGAPPEAGARPPETGARPPEADADAVRGLGMEVLVADTLMTGEAERARLAREVIAWASGLWSL